MGGDSDNRFVPNIDSLSSWGPLGTYGLNSPLLYIDDGPGLFLRSIVCLAFVGMGILVIPMLVNWVPNAHILLFDGPVFFDLMSECFFLICVKSFMLTSSMSLPILCSFVGIIVCFVSNLCLEDLAYSLVF